MGPMAGSSVFPCPDQEVIKALHQVLDAKGFRIKIKEKNHIQAFNVFGGRRWLSTTALDCYVLPLKHGATRLQVTAMEEVVKCRLYRNHNFKYLVWNFFFKYRKQTVVSADVIQDKGYYDSLFEDIRSHIPVKT
jgi:hypothetical protein